MKNQFFKAPRYVFRKLNIMSIVETLDAKSFIDVGCGAGELACSLAERGLTGVGTDFSADAIKTASNLRKQRGIKSTDLSFIQATGAPGKHQYDLVVCCEVLEHVKDDNELLKTLMAQSNKYLLISVPAKRRLFDASDEAVGHFRRYDRKDLLGLLEKQNLHIIQFHSYGFPFINLVRILRKILFIIKLNKNKSESLEDRSKDSGINPVKPPKLLYRVDLEKVLIPFYWFSKLFNRYDFSEGYLVLCEKVSK